MNDTQKIFVSIIIVNYNLTQYIERLVVSINKFLPSIINYEIIIVDNNSPERDIETFAEKYKEEIKFLFLDKNYGFGYANNRGIEIAKHDYFLLLNPDTYFTDDSMKLLFDAFLKNKNWGVAGPKVYYSTGKIQESALRYPNIRYEIYSFFGVLSYIIRYSKKLRRAIFNDKFYYSDFLFGSCLLIRKKTHLEIGGFDEDYFLFSEETDYCYRVNKQTDYKIVYFPKSKIFHESGAITKKTPYKRELQNYNSKLIFINKHYSKIYSFFFRQVVILLFRKKIFAKKINNDFEAIKYYSEIISIYKKNKPELNEFTR